MIVTTDNINKIHLKDTPFKSCILLRHRWINLQYAFTLMCIQMFLFPHWLHKLYKWLTIYPPNRHIRTFLLVITNKMRELKFDINTSRYRFKNWTLQEHSFIGVREQKGILIKVKKMSNFNYIMYVIGLI